MKRFVIGCLVATACMFFVSSCGGGGTEAEKVAKAICECSKAKDDATKGLCILGVMVKYEKQMEDEKFQKEMEAALKKVCPDLDPDSLFK